MAGVDAEQFQPHFLTLPLIGGYGIDALLEIVFPGADIVQWLMKNLSIEDPGTFLHTE